MPLENAWRDHCCRLSGIQFCRRLERYESADELASRVSGELIGCSLEPREATPRAESRCVDS